MFAGVGRKPRNSKKQGDYTREGYAIMLNHKQRQRENRKAKRQLKRQLKIQSEAVTDRSPVSEYKILDRRFSDYAVNKTKSDIRSGAIGAEREALLSKVISLRNELNPSERRA